MSNKRISNNALLITQSGYLLFDTVCDGCEEKEKWDGVIVSGGTPLCSLAMDHTESRGGHATVEMLSIKHGWWRPTKTSRDVLPCYNDDACQGGITGADGFCGTGYKGPCETGLHGLL